MQREITFELEYCIYNMKFSVPRTSHLLYTVHHLRYNLFPNDLFLKAIVEMLGSIELQTTETNSHNIKGKKQGRVPGWQARESYPASSSGLTRHSNYCSKASKLAYLCFNPSRQHQSTTNSLRDNANHTLTEVEVSTPYRSMHRYLKQLTHMKSVSVNFEPSSSIDSGQTNSRLSTPPHLQILYPPLNKYLSIRRLTKSRPAQCKSLPSSFRRETRTLEFKIFGGSIECIKRLTWSAHEEMEGRRIVRLHKIQHGTSLNVIFVPLRPSQYINHLRFVEEDFLDVSCIKFTNEECNTTEFLITSAEVIKIIEYLVGVGLLLRKDRGRIRSNLATLWHKDLTPADSIEAQRLHLQILRYDSQKPYNILKDMRMLSWDALEVAIRRALLFYVVLVPVPVPASNSKPL